MKIYILLIILKTYSLNENIYQFNVLLMSEITRQYYSIMKTNTSKKGNFGIVKHVACVSQQKLSTHLSHMWVDFPSLTPMKCYH